MRCQISVGATSIYFWLFWFCRNDGVLDKKFGPIGRLSLVPATRHASRMFLER
jgi:hypothetical protein